jgi:hypothetical protein
MSQPSPSHILQLGMAFFGSKTLLSAVELGLFTTLTKEGPLTGPELGTALGLHPRAVPDFPDALVALGLLERDGDGEGARYANTPDTGLFLDKQSPMYVGGILEMANDRLYPFWAHLSEGLRTGEPQNEIKHTGEPLFATLFADPMRLEQFMDAMNGVSTPGFQALVESFDFGRFRTHLDVGGATGQLSCLVAGRYPDVTCRSFDLPVVEPIARKAIAAAGLADRVAAVSGDFFAEALPSADVITMGQILHDWNLEKKKLLIGKVFDALPEGGAFVVVEAFIDDARRTNAHGLLMSLNMMMEFGDAFDYSAADLEGWCREAGFQRFERITLGGPTGAVVAWK